MCKTYKTVIKTKLGNTTGLDCHLLRNHSKVYELYKVKRAEMKERLTRKLRLDVVKSKQSNLEFKSGILNMKPPPPSPQVQKADVVTIFC